MTTIIIYSVLIAAALIVQLVVESHSIRRAR